MRRFDSSYKAFGILLSTMSLVMLIRQGYDVGWVAPFKAMLEWYQEVIQFLFWWPERWLRDALNEWNVWTGWHLHLYPQWKHVCILMWFYFFSFTKAQVEEYGMSSEDRHSRMIPYTLWSAAVSIITGIATGLIPIGDTSGVWYSDLSLAIIVGSGVLIFWEVWLPGGVPWIGDLSQPHHYSPTSRIRTALLVVAVPALLIAVTEYLYGESIRMLPSPSLTFLLIFVFLLAVNWLVGGALYTLFRGPMDYFMRQPNSALQIWKYYLANGLTRAGSIMLSAIVSAVAIVAFNAGLKYAGL